MHPRSGLFRLLRSASQNKFARAFRTKFIMADGVQGIPVAKDEMKRFMVECMSSVGTSEAHASQLADVLIAGDYRGHYSHGLNRLDMYINDIKKKVCKSEGSPIILKEKGATAWVDGNNLLGPVVGMFCTNLAIRKAKDTGIGWVVAKALAAPGTQGDSFVLDMATSAVAVGKVEIAHRRGEKELPSGWGVDKEGKDSRDPEKVLGGGGLHPLGGTEINSGYKGYGLGMMVEIFCGMLGDGAWGPNVRRWMATDRDANLGQCFIAIDPDAFAPGFAERMQSLMDTCRNLKPIEGEEEVLVAGDPERKHMAECDKLGGIPYHPNQITHAVSPTHIHSILRHKGPWGCLAYPNLRKCTHRKILGFRKNWRKVWM